MAAAQNGNGNGNALVKPQENEAIKALSRYLEDRAGKLADYAMGKLSPATMIRLAVFTVANDKQGHLIKCRPETIYSALVLSAQLGLEPSGIRGEAYLVGYNGNCQLIPGYRGLIKLARQSGVVTDIYSHVVYEHDTCEVDLGSDPKVVHRPLMTGKRGEIVATYAVARVAGSERPDIEFMSGEDIDDLVQWVTKSRGGKMPSTYQDWFSEMVRKAPIRRLSKRLPAGEAFARAVHADNLAEQGKSAQEVLGVIDVEAVETEQAEAPQQSSGTGSRLADRIDSKNAAGRDA